MIINGRVLFFQVTWNCDGFYHCLLQCMFLNCNSFTPIHIWQMIVMRILMELAFWLTNLKDVLKQFSTSLKNYCQNILDHAWVDTGKYSTFVHSVTFDHKFDISMVFSVFIFSFLFYRCPLGGGRHVFPGDHDYHSQPSRANHL